MRRGVCTRVRNGWRLNEWDIVSDCEVRDLGVDECVKVVSACFYDVWQRRWDVCDKGRVMYGFIRNVRFANLSAVNLSRVYGWATS